MRLKNFIKNLFLCIFFILSFYLSSAYASYIPFNTSSAGNIGIGSAAPGQKLDIAGTVRAANFIGSGAGLTGLPSSGLWNTINTNDVYEQNSSTWGNVGIGTSITNAGAAFSVMNGNVGIGTWVPGHMLDIPNYNTVNSQLRLGGLEFQPYALNNEWFGDNVYYNGSAFVYRNTGAAGLFYFEGTEGQLRFVPSGTAGSLFPGVNNNGYIQFRVNSNGDVGLGGNMTITSQGVSNYTGATMVLTGGNVGIGTLTPAGALTVMSGNVGIGTWAPQDSLYIVTSGTSGFKAQNINSQSTIGGAGLAGFQDDGTAMVAGNRLGFLVFGGSGDTAHSVNSNAAGITAYADGNFTTSSIPANLRFETAPSGSLTRTERMRIDSNGNIGIGTSLLAGGLVVMNGNVGIGTWVPANALDVHGGNVNVYAGGIISTGNITTTQGSLISDGALSVTTFGTIGTTLSVGTSLFTVGNVGIGTGNITGPQAIVNKLSVNGGVGIGTISPTGSSLYMSTLAPAGGMIVQGNVGIGSLTPGQALDVTGTVRATNFIGSGAGLTGLPSGGLWNTINTNDVYEQNSSTFGNVGIGTSTTNAGAALSVMNGNVGIGTWVPAHEVDVETYGNLPLFLKDRNASWWSAEEFENSNATIDASFGIGNPSAATFANSGYFNIIQAYPFAIGTNNLERMRVDANGNVGIGTSTPVGGLSVMNGNVGIGTWVPATSLDIGPNSSSTNYIGIAGSRAMFGYDASNLDLALNAGGLKGMEFFVNGTNGTYLSGTQAMTISSGGNVGIGTWVPGAALQVNNTISFQSEYNNGNSGTSLTVNWNNGNRQKVTMTGNCTFTFTAPSSGVTNLLLKLVQDGTGSRTATWPAAVKWPSGSTPTLTTTASQEDVVTCYYDGTDYLCTIGLNYTP